MLEHAGTIQLWILPPSEPARHCDQFPRFQTRITNPFWWSYLLGYIYSQYRRYQWFQYFFEPFIRITALSHILSGKNEAIWSNMKQRKRSGETWWNTSGTRFFSKKIGSQNSQNLSIACWRKDHPCVKNHPELLKLMCRSMPFRSFPFLLASALQRPMPNKSSYKQILQMAQLQKMQNLQPMKVILGMQASTATMLSANQSKHLYNL